MLRAWRARGTLLLVAALAAPALGAVPASAVPEDLPYVERACTPEGPLDVERPAGCKRILFTYGPLHVTPGANLILIGPVTIERPAFEGHIVRFKPDLVRLDWSVPPIEEIHLHHAVWISTRFGPPVFASGEEKTIISLPNGYGLPYSPTGEAWLLNYMLHNQLPTADNVIITYELDIIPTSTVPAGSIKPVQPHWIDVGSHNGFNPVYNTQRGYGETPGECAFPREQCAAFDPYGNTVTGNGRAGNDRGYERGVGGDGTVVWMLGHLHPGGLRLELDLVRGGQSRRVFNSHAVYFDPNGPLSWDMSMQVTRPDYRLQVRSGDTFRLNSIYDSEHASWYEAMGIVIAYIARGDTSGPDPFESSVDPDNVGITHGHMPEAGNHGGPDRDPLAEPLARADTRDVAIAGFSYVPGNLGTEGVTVPAVRRGQTLRFTNADAPMLIFHTVTACRAPCNGPTGISYPIANGAGDFDSLQLGYGPPGITAAANRATYELPTGGLDPGTYTYFCRVHPFMRGAFQVT